ncbi:helix-turn-helix domain-containing protein [Halegenticoccus soli]|uniref:helix-turn-helix domain-containing protein n=1 Tax=Halegenticoccus soli TaxID=1985678 RepID=UPI000C6CA746|nr:helix-turn-helix domain-containing protein [Halegenticoccus soli]
MFQAELNLKQEKACVLSELSRRVTSPLRIEIEELHDHKVTFIVDAGEEFETAHRCLAESDEVLHLDAIGDEQLLVTKPSCGAYSAVYKNHGVLRRQNYISDTQRVYNVLVFRREDLKDIVADFKDIGTVTLGKLTKYDEPRSVLTARQREVIEHAFSRGYFRWPREATSEELAADLDISRATFLEHLRKAEAKLLSQLLDDDPHSRPRIGVRAR